MIKTIAVFKNRPHRKEVWGYDIIYKDGLTESGDISCYGVGIDHAIRETCSIMGKSLTPHDFQIQDDNYAFWCDR